MEKENQIPEKQVGDTSKDDELKKKSEETKGQERSDDKPADVNRLLRVYHLDGSWR